ncbi:MAG: hypothetical protein PVF46_09945, partial [Lysobacterales bacterium]
MNMNRFLLTATAIAGVLMSPLAFTSGGGVESAVAISIQAGQETWAGQQVTVDLDLKTTGYSFSNAHFNLPEVAGAFLMQTDTTTLKLTERINGTSWQIVRYPLALYPQKSGRLIIPPIDVRFTTSAGFGSAEMAFELQTEALELNVSLPPGAKEGALLVTTASFELDHSWQPVSGTASIGDAFTLTVTRRVKNISAMLLPPLPVFQIEGLSVYPQAPEINDRTSRGDLTGERIDSVIWIVEKPGSYAIPGTRFNWWDPEREELQQRIVPGLSIQATAPATRAGSLDQLADDETGPSRLYPALLIALAGMLGIFTWLRIRHRDRNTQPEKAAFSRLLKACRNNQPGQAYDAVHEWLGFYPAATGRKYATLDAFARAWRMENLARESERLQQALTADDTQWRGS